jgi:hypothetical protein
MLAPLRIAASASVDIAKALGKLPGGGKKGKKRVKKAFNGVYTRCEDAGLIPRRTTSRTTGEIIPSS